MNAAGSNTRAMNSATSVLASRTIMLGDGEETTRSSQPAAHSGVGRQILRCHPTVPTTSTSHAVAADSKRAQAATCAANTTTLMMRLAVVLISMATVLPQTAQADVIHGIRYKYVVNEKGRTGWAAPVDSCRLPGHDLVLRNYSQGEFHEDAMEAYNFWGEGNVGDIERRRYLIVRKLSEGSEGAAYEAIDRETGKLVAIKKVSNIFKDPKRLITPKQILAEVKSLAITKSSPDFMRLNRLLVPRHPHNFDTIFIVLDMLESAVPVASGKHAGDITSPEAADTLRLRVFQLVRGMAFLHSAGVVHGDMRYHNVMIDDECNVRIIDLGDLVPAVEHEKNIIARFPGAGLHHYIDRDLWMMGTTILTWVGGYEMYMDKGTQGAEHAKGIVDVLGFQTEETLSKCSSTIQDNFHEVQDSYIESGHMPPSLEERLPTVDPRLFTMVRRIMRLDRKVPSAMELLEDPYFEGLHRRQPVPKGPSSAAKKLMTIWKECNSVRDARHMIYEEVLKNRYGPDADHDL